MKRILKFIEINLSILSIVSVLVGITDGKKNSVRDGVGIYERYIKRSLDFFLSGIALMMLSPILLVSALLIVAEDPGPIFFSQNRVGRNQNIFRVFKLRSMCVDAEKYQKPGVEVRGKDPRILKVGYLLRRFKIDELPQLFNILKGDMSIIGSRPSLVEYLETYEEWEKERFDVRPGLSGLAQVNGNIYLEPQEKSKYDVEYVHSLSFIMDVKIVLKTFLVVMFGEEKFKK